MVIIIYIHSPVLFIFVFFFRQFYLEPTFVSSFPHNGHVYFLFRETAVEHINCGKARYSRVARVCAKDNGGPHKFRFVIIDLFIKKLIF